jgi:hypothetical protein
MFQQLIEAVSGSFEDTAATHSTDDQCPEK